MIEKNKVNFSSGQRFVCRSLSRLLLRLHNLSDVYASKMAKFIEPNRLHPKHRLMEYHNWFLNRLSFDWLVLDIGCGNGALCFDMAKCCRKVIGIDINPDNIRAAKAQYCADNIEYLTCDVRKYESPVRPDVITMSNVLEHIRDRQQLLSCLKKICSRFLIRVPMIERDWITLYKKELGIEHRLDPTHFIEYTFE